MSAFYFFKTAIVAFYIYYDITFIIVVSQTLFMLDSGIGFLSGGWLLEPDSQQALICSLLANKTAQLDKQIALWPSLLHNYSSAQALGDELELAPYQKSACF